MFLSEDVKVFLLFLFRLGQSSKESTPYYPKHFRSFH